MIFKISTSLGPAILVPAPKKLKVPSCKTRLLKPFFNEHLRPFFVDARMEIISRAFASN